ncbi:MAG TPA: D-glycero-beta-D-manno-heptose 1-phosphate adenylyltransferase, partial [Intrasporangium sp.]|uniref:D-glycero-beta-D-manno-heptose 1-phosphate adenylyltransferase n=1 Tax=Intrasporangium sp. TaxID=1925024 RepID=UPI002D76AA9C
VLRALEEAGAVLVADYGRGAVEAPGIRGALTALARTVPVTWDPHPRGGAPVPGVRLATPNRAEAAGFAARHGDDGRDAGGNAGGDAGSSLATVRRHADLLVGAWQASAVAVTLGERGALLSYGSGTPVLTPAPSVPCADPCGAGDRFAATAALSLAAGRVTTEAVQDAVAAAAAYVAAGGPASLTAGPAPDAGRPEPGRVEEVRRRGGVVVATGGCFDLLHAGHVATLRAARSLGDCLVVCLNSDESVRRLKGPTRPLVPAADRARVLQALECVDAVVVFEEDTPAEVLRRVRPHVWAKGGDYAGADVPEARVLEEWGGQAVVLPYLQGRSTTALVRTAAATTAARAADTGRKS